MTLFADSSALVKLYVPEPGHEAVTEFTGPMIVSELARVEVPSGLWRKQRLGELAAADTALLVDAFEDDYYGGPTSSPRFGVIRVSDERLRRAAVAVARHGLRAFDALQLACALTAREAGLIGGLRFATFDRHLRSAALVEGFTLVPEIAHLV